MIRVPTFAVCLAVSLFQTAHCQISVRAKNPAVFGTNTGYDAGGEDPVCWVSELSYQDTLPGTVTSDVEVKDGRLQQLPRVQIKDLDDLLFSRAFDSSELLQTCGAATTLAIHVLSEDLVFDAGKSYDFSVEMLLKNISDLHASYYGRESVLLSYSRVVLCNTLENRFCTPIFPQPLESYTVANTTSFVTAGDSSVVSGWEILDFDGEISSNSTYNIFSNHRVALPGNISGTFFAIGHVVTSIISQHKLIRYDVANAVSGGVITIRRPPKVREVTTGAKIGLACLVAISASFALYILVYLVVRRNEAIIQLAQGKFLAAISAGCLLQIVSSFVFLPTNSLYCDLFGLLILFPMTFVASCLVGRVWRVHKTLSIAQTMGRQRTKQEQTLIVRMEGSLVSFLDRLARIPLLQCRSNSRINGRRSLRETVTDAQTTGLIAMLALPQLSFQIYVLSIGRRVIYIEDALGTVSRLYCDQAGRWTSAVGLAYMITILMLAVAMGWVSRFLPSAFNEKALIFQAASVSTFLAVLSIMMWRPITDAGTAPDLSLFIEVALSISIPMVVLVIIVLPKVRRSQSGEKVVMTNLVSARFLAPTITPKPASSYALDRNSSQLPTIESGIEEDIPVKFAIESSRRLLKVDDPLPREVEASIIGFQGILRGITRKFAQGRAISPTQIEDLRGKVSNLAMQLDLLDVEERKEMRRDG